MPPQYQQSPRTQQAQPSQRSPQVPFLKFLPVTINVGIFAFLWLWIGLQFQLALWVPFIGWSMWYVIGPTLHIRKKRFIENVIGALGGVVYAVVFLMLIPVLVGLFGSFTIPVLGFLAGMTIVLLELTRLFEVATSYFFTFAGYFAFVFAAGAFGAMGDYGILFSGSYGAFASYVGDAFQYALLILVGFAIGFTTDTMRFWILSMQGLKDETQQKTVFDSEVA